MLTREAKAREYGRVEQVQMVKILDMETVLPCLDDAMASISFLASSQEYKHQVNVVSNDESSATVSQSTV